jgi:hypothetical protein
MSGAGQAAHLAAPLNEGSALVQLVFRSVRCVELGIRGTRARSGFDGLGLTPKPFLFSRNHTQLTKLPLQELSAQEKGRTE